MPEYVIFILKQIVFKRDLQVRKYSLKFWSIRVFTSNPRCSNEKLFKEYVTFCIYCCIFQEQLSIKTPLGDCFWVFFISFCKCHGKYCIYEILFALCFIYLYSEWTVEPFTTKTTESRCCSNYILSYYKSYQQTLYKRKMWGAFEEETGEQ